MKNMYFIILVLIVGFYIINEIKKKKFSIKESFWWVIGTLVMLLLAIFPQSIDKFATFMGISYPPSLLFALCIVFLLFINFKNSKHIAEQREKIIELAQEVSILKSKNSIDNKK
jgi:hypothetical protein